MSINKRFSVGLIAILAFVLALPGAAAHETFKQGKYSVTVGFQNEPPIVGQSNVVTVEIVDSSASDAPVTGLQDVKGTLSYGGKTMDVDFEESDESPGTYFAGLIPGHEGIYHIKVTTNIKGTAFNHDFPLQNVESASDHTFPPATASWDMMQYVAWGIAGLALIIAIVALVVGMGAKSTANAAKSAAASRPSTPPPSTPSSGHRSTVGTPPRRPQPPANR